MMNFFRDKIFWLFLKSNLKKFQKLYDKDNGIVKEKYLTIYEVEIKKHFLVGSGFFVDVLTIASFLIVYILYCLTADEGCLAL